MALRHFSYHPLCRHLITAKRAVGVSSRFPMPARNIQKQLEGGDRRSIGRSDEVARLVSKNLALLPQLVAGLWSEHPVVRMRAADALEQVTRAHPASLQKYKK